MTQCRLCGAAASAFMRVDDKDYFACKICGLRFIGAEYLPTNADEKAHYDQHENNLDDPKYRQFLSQLAAPLLSRLLPRDNPPSILDFGAGPGPLLAKMLKEAGCNVQVYDPFYAPDPSPLDEHYDAVCATEVVEHFHNPNLMFARMDQMVRQGGYLAIMTKLQDDDATFAQWHYRRDPTHVAFYRAETFAWIAAHYGYQLELPAPNIMIMRKD